MKDVVRIEGTGVTDSNLTMLVQNAPDIRKQGNCEVMFEAILRSIYSTQPGGGCDEKNFACLIVGSS
jgi:hypothetical protein